MVFVTVGHAPWEEKYILPAHHRFGSCTSPAERFCPDDLDLSRCRSSTKCISRHRLLDRITDCVHGDDEDLVSVQPFVQVESTKDFYYCSTGKSYIAARLVDNGYCDCPADENNLCDDESSLTRYVPDHSSSILFIC